MLKSIQDVREDKTVQDLHNLNFKVETVVSWAQTSVFLAEESCKGVKTGTEAHWVRSSPPSSRLQSDCFHFPGPPPTLKNHEFCFGCDINQVLSLLPAVNNT